MCKKLVDEIIQSWAMDSSCCIFVGFFFKNRYRFGGLLEPHIRTDDFAVQRIGWICVTPASLRIYLPWKNPPPSNATCSLESPLSHVFTFTSLNYRGWKSSKKAWCCQNKDVACASHVPWQSELNALVRSGCGYIRNVSNEEKIYTEGK